MFAVTAILSCIIKIRGLFKSTKWRHFENVKFEALSARRDVENVSYSFENGTVTILESESSGPESSDDEEIHSESQQCCQTDEDNYKHQM